MIVLYDSLTGQGKRFANSLGFTTDNVKTYQPHDHTPVFLITRSFNFGEVSPDAKDFLDKYQHLVVGLAVSGNRNWGKNFGAAGEKIEKQYGIPLVLKFEASGLPNEIQFVKKWITNYQNQKLKEK